MLKPLLRLSIIMILVTTISYLYVGKYDATLLPGFIIILCIPVLPTFYLCMEYYFVTRNQTVKLTYESISISYNNGKIDHYAFDEIEILKLYKSAGMEKGSFPFQTAEMYYHAELITKNGNKLVLTSILGPDFDAAMDILKGINRQVIRTIYSTIYI